MTSHARLIKLLLVAAAIAAFAPLPVKQVYSMGADDRGNITSVGYTHRLNIFSSEDPQPLEVGKSGASQAMDLESALLVERQRRRQLTLALVLLVAAYVLRSRAARESEAVGVTAAGQVGSGHT